MVKQLESLITAQPSVLAAVVAPLAAPAGAAPAATARAAASPPTAGAPAASPPAAAPVTAALAATTLTAAAPAAAAAAAPAALSKREVRVLAHLPGDPGVTGAGPAERKERTAAGMLRAEKKKKLSCLSVSHGACVSPIIDLLGAFCVVSQQHIFGDTDTFDTFPFSPSLSLVDPALGRR